MTTQEPRRWTLFRRERRPTRSASAGTDESEISTTSTGERRNNSVELETLTPPPKPSTAQSALTESSYPISHLEQNLLESLKACCVRLRELQRSGSWRRGVKLAVFVSVCVLVGLCLRTFAETPSGKLRDFLESLNLESYYPNLVLSGYDQWEDLLWAEDEDLRQAGIQMKPHRMRILRRTASMRLSWLPLLQWTALLCFISWVGACVGLVLALTLHRGFRLRCAGAALWITVTLWARLQVYKRVWEELGTTSEAPSPNETRRENNE